MADETKGALIEKIVFAAVPILFSCVVYLMATLSKAHDQITILQSKMSIVVTAENKPVAPPGLNPNLSMDFERHRAELDKRVTLLEYRMNNKEK
jgi:hypothetical protein